MIADGGVAMQRTDSNGVWPQIGAETRGYGAKTATATQAKSTTGTDSYRQPLPGSRRSRICAFLRSSAAIMPSPWLFLLASRIFVLRLESGLD